MNPNICNNCGGDYEYRSGRWICRHCGSYKPEQISNEEVTLLYTAFQKLRLADFYEAEAEFDDIIGKYPKNPSAYWGRLMAKYGIKYEQDFDGKMIPTCYATSIESIMKADDYQKALKYADEESKNYYQKQAEYIERVRCEWVEKASKEKPYDIFICYKDSDLENNIKRTKDSYTAQDIYTYLTELGYHVFYSHISLQDKVGEKYEPYIFNALSTAKVMLVYGSSPEYITSTWLKNEWMRYEKRIQAGEKSANSLLVACEGFSPSELPHTLSSIQCFDATEKRFYKNLEEKIENIIHPEKKANTGILIPKSKKRKRKLLPISLAIIAAFLVMGGLGYLLANFSTGCNHNAVIDAAVEATCAQEGLSEGSHCRLCGEIFIKQTRISKLEHTPGQAATCTTAQTCTVCNQKLADPLGHTAGTNGSCIAPSTCSTCGKFVETPDAHKPGAQATCTAAQLCTLCNKELAPSKGHTPGAQATCTTPQSCTICRAELTPAKGHTLSAQATCTTPQSCTVCHAELTSAKGHTPGAQATCTTPQICTICRTELTSAKGHTPGAQATCTTPQICTICRTELTSAKGHTPGEWIETKPATTTVNGLKEQRCTTCGTTLQTEKIPATGISYGLWYKISGQTCTITGIGSCTDRDVFIPSTIDGYRVTGIADRAFEACNTLVSIYIPDGVTSIGVCAFYNCPALTTVILPNTLTSIGNGAFQCCGRLTNLTIPNSVISIDRFAFADCLSLTSITIPDGITIINPYMFNSCSNLETVIISGSVATIDRNAFKNCTNLKTIRYNGTIQQWKTVVKNSNWSQSVPATQVICTNGTTSLN